MAQITRSTKIGGGTVLQSNTTARATDVETDIAALYAEHNAHDDGSKVWGRVLATSSAATPIIADNNSGTNDIFEARDNGAAVFTIADGGAITATGDLTLTGDLSISGSLTSPLFGYRRPVLTWVNDTSVDIEANTGTSNRSRVVFPDGESRSVTEDTSSTDLYRRFIITSTAEFESGTEDSGLRSGLSEVNNTWYAVYAVKSQINTDNFVLVGDTTYPTAANFATLNTRYGTDSWIYLGLIVNGNNANNTNNISQFIQSGNVTFLRESTPSATNVITGFGSILATGAAATSLTWTYASGTALPSLPSHLVWGKIVFAQTGNASGTRITDSSASVDMIRFGGTTTITISHIQDLTKGANVASGDGGNENYDVFLAAWSDPILGNGINPLI